MTQKPLLGPFIRSRREKLSPERVGLQAGSRRRAKGLRREELAALCGISPTWLTWIEQGRTESISANALARIAKSLLLTKAEREYLFELASLRDPEKSAMWIGVDVQETLDRMVIQIRSPAYVLDHSWKAIAWNRPATNLFPGWLGTKAQSKHLLHYMFLHRPARKFISDWPVRAQRLVAEFRADCSTYLDDFNVAEQVTELCAKSREFNTLWQYQNVLEREGGERTFNHPTQGVLVFQQLTLRITHSPNLKLVILL